MSSNLPVEDAQAVAYAVNVLQQSLMKRDTVFSDPAATRNYLTLKLAHLEHEVFGVLFLDNRHRLIHDEIMFRGTIDGASVYPREVVKEAMAHNAGAVCFYHNHPSQVPEPSAADRSITQRLTDALALLDVRVLDHLIIGGCDVTSFAERGLI